MNRDTVFCVLCVLLTLALGVCALRYVTDFWLLSFVYSLQTHIGIACTLGVLATLAIKRNRYAYVLLAVAILLTGHSLVMLREFRQAPSAEALAAAKFKLLSFNILGDNLENGSRIADFIIGSGADVAYVLEAQPVYDELPRLSLTYPYHIGCSEKKWQCDLLVLSRHPFVESATRSLSDLRKNRFAMATIELGGTQVHFAAAHLSKPYFDDYHTEELYQVARQIVKVDGPLILAGDFNSAVIAPDMQRFARRLGLKIAASEPRTWPILAGQYGIAIDHIFARAPLELISTTRIPDNMGSNHYGLISEFAIKP